MSGIIHCKGLGECWTINYTSTQMIHYSTISLIGLILIGWFKLAVNNTSTNNFKEKCSSIHRSLSYPLRPLPLALVAHRNSVVTNNP